LKSLNALEKEGKIAEFITQSRYSYVKFQGSYQDVWGPGKVYTYDEFTQPDFSEPTFVPPNTNEASIIPIARPLVKAKPSPCTAFWRTNPCSVTAMKAAVTVASLGTALLAVAYRK